MAYEVKGRTTKITATSRCALKVKDNYYTLELSEERVMPEETEVDLNREYEAIFNSINNEIDNQMQDILDSINSNKK